jgi:hypothetical protein
MAEKGRRAGSLSLSLQEDCCPMRRLANAGIVFAVVALSGGCASPPPEDARAPVTQAVAQEPVSPDPTSVPTTQLVFAEPIERAVRRYANDVRFRLFDSAVNFVEPDLRSEFRVATDHLRTIRFTGVTIEQVELDELGTTAIATVRWRGHWLQSPFERELRTTQRWRRDEASQKWYVTPELEALGANLEQIRRAPAASMPPR